MIVALSVTVSGLIVILNPHWTISWLAKRSPDVVFYVETEQPVVALTIDDGPDEHSTPLILDVLDRHGAQATMFVITEHISGNEKLLTRAVESGHELGNHMTRDERSSRLSPSDFVTELERADAELTQFDDVRWFRPGGGWFNREMVDAARQVGYETALGSVYPFDTTVPSSRFASWYVRSQVKTGSVIVLHDGGARGRRTAAALEQILPALAEQGYVVTTLSAVASVAGQ